MPTPTSVIAAEAAGAVDRDLAPGEVVGEYVVDGKLGQGAFGTVFEASHPLIGKRVAIKVLARRYSVDPEMVSRFIAEARAVNQIRHRNIIDIFAFGQLPDGRHYYVMEHLDGEPLDARLDRTGRLSLAEALPILRGVARALDAAHAKSIAHRDLKAENVFLASDEDGGPWPKLLDFGIAKLLAGDDDDAGVKHHTRTGYSIGTPYYMSPEQARGRDVDHRTDLYAFGVLAYLMLVGKYPLDAEGHMEILMRQLRDQPVPASQLVPELPAAIDVAISHLMAKDPADRPACLRDAVAAFEAAAEEVGIVVPRRASSGLRTGPATPVTTDRTRATSAATAASATRAASTATATGDALPAGVRAPRVVGLIAGLLVLALATTAIVWSLRTAEHAPPGPPPRAVTVAHPPPPVAAPPIAPALAAPIAPALAQGPVAETAAAPRWVICTITQVPAGTEVLVAGKLVGVAPGPVQLPRGGAPIVLTFKAAGHVPASRTLVPDQDRELAVVLKRRASGGKRPTRDDIIDVFEER